MKDPFSIFIGDSVYYSKTQYYKLINQTKIQFFKSLKERKSFKEFEKDVDKIWGSVNHEYMQERIEELEKMISAKNSEGKEILNPDAVFEEIFKLDSESKYIDIEKKYEKVINKYYKGRLKTLENGYVDEDTYLTKLVEKYDKAQAIIPYYNANGTIRAFHNIASYNSMVYNTNLTKAGWNRTIYDSKLLDNDLVYLPAHPGACPLCMPYQGKVYSISGNTKGYPLQEIAIAGGVGHPNCKHEWVLYWNSNQIQEDKYNNDYWQEYYENQQKIQALQLERTNLKVNQKIYEEIGNFEEVDKTKGKIKKLNSKIKELKN